MAQASHHSFQAFNQSFVIKSEYQFVRELEQSAYGSVIVAKHTPTGEGCAIRKINAVGTAMERCLREIKLLRHFRGHANIICLYDMDIIFEPNGSFNEVYLYEETMEANLSAISFIYQSLCGLKYIHSANVSHRDLKPANLLVNADCELKICGFGLARGSIPANATASPSGATGSEYFMSEYDIRWYRAPEILLSFANYVLDVWSVGCIFAELLGGKPIFKGRDHIDQVNQILHYLGTPSDGALRQVGSLRAQDYIRSLPIRPRIPFNKPYPSANPLAIDLLGKMLAFDPARRISCEEALNHPYFVLWHEPTNEPVSESKVDLAFEEENIDAMKQMIVEEVKAFRGMALEQACELRGKKPEGLPVPSPEDITSSVPSAATPHSTAPGPSIIEGPSNQLEAELAETHIASNELS